MVGHLMVFRDTAPDGSTRLTGGAIPARLGGVLQTAGNTDYNTKTDSGWYMMDSTASNRPVAATCFLEVRNYNGNYIEQVARHVITGAEYTRRMNAGTWGPWDGVLVDIAYSSGMSHYSSGSYVMKASGWATLYLEAQTSIARGTGSVILQVPSGYYPIGSRYWMQVAAGGTAHPFLLWGSGQLTYEGGGLTAGWGLLGTITYRVA